MTNIPANMNENTQMLVVSVQAGLNYLVQLSNVPEEELFKICVSFWHFFSHDVLTKTRPMSLQTAEIQVDSNLDFSNFAQYQF
jgi:hypothetical protein